MTMLDTLKKNESIWNKTWGKFFAQLDNSGNNKLSDKQVDDLFSQTLKDGRSDAKDSNDNNVLMYVVERAKNYPILESKAQQLIHQYYVNVNATNKDGMTALHFAARSGNTKICDDLINSGAILKKNNNGDYPSAFVDKAKSPELVETLKKKETSMALFKSFYRHSY